MINSADNRKIISNVRDVGNLRVADTLPKRDIIRPGMRFGSRNVLRFFLSLSLSGTEFYHWWVLNAIGSREDINGMAGNNIIMDFRLAILLLFLCHDGYLFRTFMRGR